MGRAKGIPNKKHVSLKVSICKQCGTEIRDYSSVTRVFCSISCKAIYQGEHQRGGNNPNWKEDKYYYSSPCGLRSLIKRRDVVCQDCGGHDDLHIHHLDVNPSHNGSDNLILLCKFCHAQRHVELGHPEVARIIAANHHHRYKERLTTNCAICSKTFIPRTKIIKCCSRQCAYKLIAQRHKGRVAWNKGINDISLTCSICGKLFKRSKGRLNAHKGVFHFCSKPCQIRYAIKCRVTRSISHGGSRNRTESSSL